ncbi:MAG TPA: peptidoglycan-binding domain-containing protein [Pyrinomonadaceae bacterium]|jgi:N-acetylmuramoyl-L-alanine amidase
MSTKHVVGEGESLIGISEDYGFFAETIWNHPDNAELKRLRKHMNILAPGDEVSIPDKREKVVSKPTGRLHRFRRKGVPALFRLQLLEYDEPKAMLDYVLSVDGVELGGRTDRDGFLEEYVPNNARKGLLNVNNGELLIEINFSTLNPVKEVRGYQQRLKNLGYYRGEVSGELNEETKAALAKFQRHVNLKETSEPDAATLDKLSQIHDQEEQFEESAR